MGIGGTLVLPENDKMVDKMKTVMDEQREENLREMKSPASLALLGVSFVLLLLAFVFYDRPLVDDNRILSYLRGQQVASTH